MVGRKKVSAAGKVVENGSTRDGNFDLEREGKGFKCVGEEEEEGGIEVGGEEVDTSFIRYFSVDLACTLHANTTIRTWFLGFYCAVFAACAEIVVIKVGYKWRLSIAALELGDQLVFFSQVFSHNFIEQCFSQLRWIVNLVKSHESLSEEEGSRGSRRCRNGIGCGDGSTGGERGGGRSHFVLLAFTPK